MARKKWREKYKANCACTVRLIDKMGLRETSINGERPNRRVFADAWFASVETALALRDEMGVNFTGPIKISQRYFEIYSIRLTLSSMNFGV